MDEKPRNPWQFGIARLLAITAIAALFTWMATWDEVPGHGLALISLAAVGGIVASTGTVRASALCGGLAAAAAAPLPILMDIQGPAFGFLMAPIFGFVWGAFLGASVGAIRSMPVPPT